MPIAIHDQPCSLHRPIGLCMHRPKNKRYHRDTYLALLNQMGYPHGFATDQTRPALCQPIAVNATTYYIPILKNAHTWATHLFESVNATVTAHDPNYLVLLRDPIQRWITGTNTYIRRWRLLRDLYEEYVRSGSRLELYQNQLWQQFDRLLEHSLILDQHTVPQWAYLDHLSNVNSSRFNFIIIDKNLSENIQQQYSISSSPSAVNPTSGTHSAEFFHEQLTQYMEQRNLREQLMQIYSKDYELLQAAQSH